MAKWSKSTNIELLCAELGAEGIVVGKNFCLCGTSILVQKTKGVKGFGLKHCGILIKGGDQEFDSLIMFCCKVSLILVAMQSRCVGLVELVFSWPLLDLIIGW